MRDLRQTQTLQFPSPGSLLRHIELDCIELEVIAGPEAGLRRRLTLPVVRLGTAPDNDVVLTDPRVSRFHAELRLTPRGLVVRDLDSTNGTFCGGVRVIEAFLEPDIDCALASTRLRVRRDRESQAYAVGSEQSLGGLVGASRPMRELYGLLKAIAPTPTTVLIRGESGCGKEVVARTLHELSGRKGPLVVFDASVTDPEMVRNDLFGHVRGAFTGAQGAREGAFRRAHGGTLFIDEIGELPLELQPRLLRALESREVVPVGADDPVKVDVRVIAATHRDLDAMVVQQCFRADLFYRLSVMTVPVPALRTIKEDLPLLVDCFARQFGLRGPVSAPALQALRAYHWPGNVRELRNVLERAAVLCGGGRVEPAHLCLPAAAPGTELANTAPTLVNQDADVDLDAAELKAVERRMIERALARTHQNKAAAARLLGISLSTLKRRVAEYGL
jgi:DNA-binding NtrC family response regulator